MKKIFFAFTLVAFTTITAFCQAPKFGYVNSQELLSEMPEIKQADTDLDTYQKQLMAKGQEMIKELETEYQKYVADAKQGLLSQVQIQQTEGDLQMKQQAIQQYEVEVQEKLATKRETLYKPILDKVKGAIETYGKEMGYTMIFDTSTGTLLHASEEDNVIDAIREKLKS